uniref:DUF2501 domain-containing protein n=1 Tax=Burkholderia arboris TaxID=488730 RepID=UPI003BEEBB0B
MKTRFIRLATAGALLGALAGFFAPVCAVHAQGNLLNQITGGNADGAANSGSSSGALSALGTITGAAPGGGSSLVPDSTGNVAGLLKFCVENNYLSGASGGTASSVKDALLGKLGGDTSSNIGYTSGASGVLDAGGGKTLDLSGGGIKQQVAKQVCDKVLTQAKSLL